jgi:uncharacterized membrane protein
MANAWARDRANWFYLSTPLVGIAAIAIGFSTTYFLPIWRRTLDIPPVVHFHGALNLSWVLLVLSQVVLVRTRNTPLHRRIGWVGLPLAAAMLVTGCVVAVWTAKRDFPVQGPVAASSMIGVVTSFTIFIGLVTLAIVWRRWPDWHKRLMLLATIVVLWPAWFRMRHLVPWVPRPDIWFAVVAADSLIVIAAVRDAIKYKRIHPVWLYFGSTVFLEASVEIYAFDSPPWRAVGLWIFRTLA